MWHILRIKNAIQQEEKRKQSSGYNIEPYVKRKKRDFHVRRKVNREYTQQPTKTQIRRRRPPSEGYK